MNTSNNLRINTIKNKYILADLPKELQTTSFLSYFIDPTDPKPGNSCFSTMKLSLIKSCHSDLEIKVQHFDCSKYFLLCIRWGWGPFRCCANTSLELTFFRCLKNFTQANNIWMEYSVRNCRQLLCCQWINNFNIPQTHTTCNVVPLSWWCNNRPAKNMWKQWRCNNFKQGHFLERKIEAISKDQILLLKFLIMEIS